MIISYFIKEIFLLENIFNKMAADDGSDFLNAFSDYTSASDLYGETDDQWIQKCFGRKGDRVRKDFKDHLSGHFIEKCSGETGEHSFDSFKIASSDILKQVDERFICDKCNKSRRFYCYSCFILSPQLESHLPTISLPIRIDIVKHVKEIDGKSTATHAVVLAPNETRIYTYPTLPDDWPEDPNKILLVFPRKGATPTISEYLCKHFTSLLHPDNEIGKQLIKGDDSDDNGNEKPTLPPSPSHLFAFPFERVLFIDSTWRQSKAILNDPRIKRLPAVMIDSEETRFWRCGKERPVHFLSTIEAIYYFCLQLHNFMADLVAEHRTLADDQLMRQFSQYDGQFDNLLFFFKHTYQVIKNRYKL